MYLDKPFRSNYSYVPVPTAMGHIFALLSAGSDHTCGIDTTGRAGVRMPMA